MRNDQRLQELYNYVNWALIALMILGLFLIILIEYKNFTQLNLETDKTTGKVITVLPEQQAINCHNSVVYFIDSLGLITIIAGAAFMLGGLGGFLFGVPKMNDGNIQNSSTLQSVNGSDKPRVLPNNNLVQISDWLTKIILGVSLTQMHKIPGYLESIGAYVITNSKINSNAVIIDSIIVYYFIGGIAISYLWTQIYYGRMLELAFEPKIENKTE